MSIYRMIMNEFYRRVGRMNARVAGPHAMSMPPQGKSLGFDTELTIDGGAQQNAGSTAIASYPPLMRRAHYTAWRCGVRGHAFIAVAAMSWMNVGSVESLAISAIPWATPA